MKNWKIVVLSLITIFCLQQNVAQEINSVDLSTVDVDSLSDEQILTYWNKAKGEGYTLDQLQVIAISKGVSADQFSKLRQRISSLKYSDSNTTNNAVSDPSGAEISNLSKFGIDGKTSDKVVKSNLFGFDFFNNPNISFTPNLNLATPTTYQLGPGDELLIDVWGAAENNYRKQVDREGAIHIESIGPVYVSGLSIEKAKSKIISYLKKIYSGIGASNSSFNKVHADVSLVGVRTVQVNIIGEIKVPGTYSLSGLSTVLNALYAAGGPTENGTFRNIKVVRGGETFGKFDIYNYLINGSEKGNVMLQDQDVIIVSPYTSKIQVFGNVKRPGIFELKKGETIEDLINYFSGFTATAYKERLLVERVNGKQKEVHEIVLNEAENFELVDGDVLTVGAIIDRYENRVIIEGAVYRSGNYELTKGLSLYDLIEKAAGVTNDVFLDRGIIYRTIDDVKQEIVSFSVKEILEKTSDVKLKREDSIRIFSKGSLEENKTISIDGAVNNPQTVGFVEKMRIEDFIAISGGFKEGADVEVIDISRRVLDSSFETISKNIKKSSSDKLELSANNNFYLEPFDRVSVRYLKGFTLQKNVSIQGEVHYPGNYSLIDKDERISDLVGKAGGLSPYAHLKGATLFRSSTSLSEKTQIELLNQLSLKDSISEVVSENKEFKIGINLEEIMEVAGQKSDIDLILKEGDVLMIPTEKQTVKVTGAVLSPSLIRFEEKNSLKDYINYSGGFSETAKKKKTYVIYANGDIRATKNFIFFRTYPKLESGAIIHVPLKQEIRNRMTLAEILAITTALGTLGILIGNF